MTLRAQQKSEWIQLTVALAMRQRRACTRSGALVCSAAQRNRDRPPHAHARRARASRAGTRVRTVPRSLRSRRYRCITMVTRPRVSYKYGAARSEIWLDNRWAGHGHDMRDMHGVPAIGLFIELIHARADATRPRRYVYDCACAVGYACALAVARIFGAGRSAGSTDANPRATTSVIVLSSGVSVFLYTLYSIYT